MTPGLAEFLLVRVSEDRALAEEALRGRRWVHVIEGHTDRVELEFGEGVVCSAQHQAFASHIANWDPERVLAECEVKRRLIDPQIRTARVMDEVVRDDELEYAIARTAAESFNFTAKLMALPYDDHPDYREEWRLNPPDETA
jgi:hypothetical protein